MFYRMFWRTIHAGCWSILCTLVLLSCKNNDEQTVEQAVAARVAEFRQKEARKCHESLLREAEHMADSLLLTAARMSVEDSLNRLRPTRPEQPPPVPPIDSLTVKPIFK
jgi:hypothetical protein